MSPAGGKFKDVCKRGHVNRVRLPSGACRECSRLRDRARYQEIKSALIASNAARAKTNPEAHRDRGRAVRLGVPVAEVRRVIAESGGVCGACERPLDHKDMRVDHDHATGVVRGVLCHFCNVLEGMLHKQPEMVEMVKAYVRRAVARWEGK